MKRILPTILASLACITPAAAVDFSFAGDFRNDDDVALFTFVVGASSNVTLRSYSWAGGTNAAGTTFTAGGFDPILTLYDSTGTRIAFQDDGPAASLPADAGRRYDVLFSQPLAVGTYRVALTQYDNFGAPLLADGFARAGNPDFTGDDCGVAGGRFLSTGFNDCVQRTNVWAFDILGVESAIGPGIPEPATWTMMIAGFGGIGASLRRRRARVTGSRSVHA